MDEPREALGVISLDGRKRLVSEVSQLSPDLARRETNLARFRGSLPTRLLLGGRCRRCRVCCYRAWRHDRRGR
jgi:hypothetical protein